MALSAADPSSRRGSCTGRSGALINRALGRPTGRLFMPITHRSRYDCTFVVGATPTRQTWLARWLPVAPDNQQPVRANEDPLQLSDLAASLGRVRPCRQTCQDSASNSLALSLARVPAQQLLPSHVGPLEWRKALVWLFLVLSGASVASVRAKLLACLPELSFPENLGASRIKTALFRDYANSIVAPGSWPCRDARSSADGAGAGRSCRRRRRRRLNRRATTPARPGSSLVARKCSSSALERAWLGARDPANFRHN